MQGITSSPAQGVGYLSVYVINGKQNDASSDVYAGGPYAYENNKVKFKTAVEFSKLTKFDAIVHFLKATNFNEHMDMNNYQIKMANMETKTTMW